MNDAALKIRELRKSFGHFDLGPVDLTVPTGAMYGLIGPNGAGKTTTIDLVMGMGGKDGGTIEVFGLDHLRDEVAVKKQVGYVSPDLNFNAWGRVDRAVKFIRSFYEDWDDAYCAALMNRLRLGWDERISTLSFGARTKLGLVLALSHRPALLLLDEPLAGLDAVSKQDIFRELLEAVQDETRTVLISSHNLDDIERFTDHVGIIDNGKMLVEGPTAGLLERFRLVDCMANDGARPECMPGIRIQQHDGQRWRLLVDTQTDALERLRERGMTGITESPMSLEELFVALVRRD